MTTALTVTDADGRPIQTVGRRKEAIVRRRLRHRPVQAQRPHQQYAAHDNLSEIIYA